MDAQNVSPAIAVVMIQQVDDGLVVVDAGGTEHKATSDAELGETVRRILTDDSLPKAESVPPNQARIEEIITQQVVNRAPELAPYAGPMVTSAIAQVKAALGKVERGKPRRRPRPRPKPRPKARKPPRPGRGRGK